jgi:hypothetical protein
MRGLDEMSLRAAHCLSADQKAEKSSRGHQRGMT